MIIRSLPSVRPSEITPRSAYISRRAVLAGIAGAGLVATMPAHAWSASLNLSGSTGPAIDEPKTSREDITAYNNFYEFGVGKDDPAAYAAEMKTEPWTVKVDGLVGKPADYQLEDFVKPFALEERVYRMRCVEGWSMVIPWNGFPLADILKRAEPDAAAKFVAFETLVRPTEMRGQRGYFQALDWPYREGLRLDEAMHPLTILAVGLYGETLPNQNGAPLRLVVPWKYGFKGIKSIVRISLVAEQPATSWNLQNPGEYGFYSNVNPLVDHPRWSQATERRIGDGAIFAARRPTLPFNGYGEEVASLYAGMDLKANF